MQALPGAAHPAEHSLERTTVCVATGNAIDVSSAPVFTLVSSSHLKPQLSGNVTEKQAMHPTIPDLYAGVSSGVHHSGPIELPRP